MVIIKDWKKYYTIKESKKITEKYINKSADNLILELQKNRINKQKIQSKKNIYV